MTEPRKKHSPPRGHAGSLPAALLVAAAVVLGGCSSDRTDIDKLTGIPGMSEKMTAANAAQEKVTIAEARAHYASFTVKSYSPDHGTQVEYMAPDGQCYLWYPGNKRVLPCKWKIIKQPVKPLFNQDGRKINVTQVCYSYPANSYNPVTKQRGSSWQCGRALASSIDANGKVTLGLPPPGFAPATVDKVAGDPFALAKRKAVPFIMAKQVYSFKELKRRLN